MPCNITNTFSLASDANIQDSTTYKHTTGRYTTPASGALTAAYYAITVNAGTTIRLDIDATTGTLDTWIQLRNSVGNSDQPERSECGTDPGSAGDVNDSELAHTVPRVRHLLHRSSASGIRSNQCVQE